MKGISVKICMGTGGIAAGGAAVMEAFRDEIEKAGLGASVGTRCSVNKVGCRGFCAKDVQVDVLVDGEKTTYQFMKPEMASRVVSEHMAGGSPVWEWVAGEDYRDFHERQFKMVFSDCGNIDPEDIEEYIAVGGYDALRKALKDMSPEETLEVIKASGLRGRGGAGFPTGVKWQICREADSDAKYIICNADESDPGAFVDRSVIEGNPHAVLEGMALAAYSIGSKAGFVYIRAEYPLAVERLGIALEAARKRNFLGRKILGSGFDFDISLRLGAGAFVCGEETALIASIEGLRGMPRAKPPYPVQSGLWGSPTVVNNVETLANVPLIVRNGAEWFSSIGTEKSKGTKVFALTGKVRNSGLIEVPMGITLREIIYDIGGGMEKETALKAVQTGGPSGGCFTADMLDIKVDYESLAEAGAIMCTGGMIVFDEEDCMVNAAKYFLRFTQSESCGKCVPCRIGTKRLLEIFERITGGEGREGDIELLEALSRDVKAASLCGLGQSAPNPVLSTIRHFREEYEAHIREKRCPAGVCRELLEFGIIEELCKGCGVCLRACPAGAITGKKKKPHRLDRSLCIRCGACFDVCKFKAVSKK